MKSIDLTVGAAHSGQRLDVFLVEAGVQLSRRKIRQVIDVGGVYVNKKRVRVASRQVTRGDKVRVEYSEQALKRLKTQAPEFRPEDLLLDDAAVLAVNKPPGMPSQATLDQSISHVVPCLLKLLAAMGKAKKRQLVLVHRLDKETTGVLLVADGNEQATWLMGQFRARKVKKVYLAVCYGIPVKDEFTERSALSEIDRRTGDVRAVRSGGRPAVTHFRVLAKRPDLGVCLVECHPETGRSHQLRVHLELNGLPIVGDKRYGARHRRDLPPNLAELAAEHHLLHARSLVVAFAERGKERQIVAPLPPNFTKFLEAAALPLG